MNSTPQKDKIGDSSFTGKLTPVRFVDSPGKDIVKFDQTATTKSRLDVIVNHLLENYNKWQLAQKRGLQLCYSIEAIKTRCLEDKTKVTLYPNELQPHCDKLAVITSIFEDIAKSARESLRQLRALSRLKGVSTEIFYRTWMLADFIDFLETVVKNYEDELTVKKLVTTEIAHCQKRVDLVRFTTLWEYPQSVDDNVQIMFKFITAEIKCK